MGPPPANLDTFLVPQFLQPRRTYREPHALVPFDRPNAPMDVAIDVFGVLMYMNSGVLRRHTNIIDNIAPVLSVLEPYPYRLVARDLYNAGDSCFGIWKEGLRNPPGHAVCKASQNKIASFHSMIRAAYGDMQSFPSMIHLRSMYYLAVFFEKYLWLRDYLGKCLGLPMNQHLWKTLAWSPLENLKMAENLGISWLYRDILLHLAGQFPCFTQSQRNQVKTCLNPRSFALVWKLSLRTHRLIVEFRAQARDCYVKLMRTAIAWNERDLHGNHPSISLLHTRLLSPIHEYVPGPRLVTDLGFVKGLLDSLVEIRGLHLPSLYSQAVREDLDKCINLGTCLYSGTQFLCQPREAVPYPSNTLLPGDRFPWEQNEIDLLDPTPRSREGV